MRTNASTNVELAIAKSAYDRQDTPPATQGFAIIAMDDALYTDEVNEPQLTGPAPGDLRGRLGALVQRGRAGLRVLPAMHRLARLYFAQTRLIFPGSRSQGQAAADVCVKRGMELIPLRTVCGQSTVALFGRATNPAGNVLPESAARPTILFFYGNTQHLADRNVARLVDGLRRIGVNVLVPEYLGYGLSSGDAGEAACYATADAAYAHLLSRTDTRRVIVAGASLGGAVAIDLASRQRRIAGLITLVTFTSMPDMARVVQPGVPIWRLIRHRFDSEAKMPRVTCPALIVHSTGDALVPFAMADRLAAACGGPVSRLNIDGAGHNSMEILQGGGRAIYDAMTHFIAGICAGSTSRSGYDAARHE